MIAPTIRARLLAMPTEYREAAERVFAHAEGLALAKSHREWREASITAQCQEVWQESKTNEAIRKAQLTTALLTDGEYTKHDSLVRSEELAMKRGQADLDVLRFELACLHTVANNDGSQA